MPTKKPKTKLKTKTFIVRVVCRNPRVPSGGLGKGVLAEFEIKCTDNHGLGFETSEFQALVAKQSEALLRDVVEVTWTPKGKGKTRPRGAA